MDCFEAAGKQPKDLGSRHRLRLSFVFQNVVDCGHCLVTLPMTVTETLTNGSHRCPSQFECMSH